MIAALLLFSLQCAKTYVPPANAKAAASSLRSTKQVALHRKRRDLAAPVALSSVSITSSNSAAALATKSRNGKIKSTISIVLLLLQNSVMIVLMRISRLSTNKQMYMASTAVVICEFIKLIASMVFYGGVIKQNNILVILNDLFREMCTIDAVYVSIPSFLYVIQNNLQYIALTNISVEIYQLLIQFKIATTAVFSQILLQKMLTVRQWLSLSLLTAGIVLVQISTYLSKGRLLSLGSVSTGSLALGLACVFTNTMTSGFSAAFFERIIKLGKKVGTSSNSNSDISKSNANLWLRNMQMSFISLILATITCLVTDSNKLFVQKLPFFYGYNPLVVGVILLQSLGGLLVALVVKRTNSIVKGFVTSGGVILSCLLSSIFLHENTINLEFILGSILILGSSLFYSM